MLLIEVQSGPYPGEDDIIRNEDIYASDGSGGFTKVGMAVSSLSECR